MIVQGGQRMKWSSRHKRTLIWILSACVFFGMGAAGSRTIVKASSKTVYTCKVTRSYQHPVTGKIEDSGGSASKATGQGMVEGAVFSKGLMEVTDSGEYYLTFRMNLIDYTSKHSFSTQKQGDSGWTKESVNVTGNGSGENGKTSDFRIKVPSENVIVRCSMYVESMGRDVIFYFYPSDYSQGNSVGMKAEKVTESSKSGSAAKSTTAAQSTTEQTAAATVAQGTENSVLDEAQGLSLSTKGKTAKKTSKGTKGMAQQILVLTTSITISGLILLAASAGVVYYFRKNWERWGGDKDEYDDIYEQEAE